MKQSMKLTMALALALGAGQAGAIELGQLQVHSALGQPLVADIPLTLTQSGEDRNLSVQLGSSEDFALANIPNRPTVPLQFSVVGSGSQRTIHITSSAPINDPYLELLIRVSSAAGSRTFDSTLLLDPAGMQVAASPQPVAPPVPPVTQSQRQRASSPRISGPSRRQSAEPSARQSQPEQAVASKVNGDQYGPIQRGQNLSVVARATAQQAGVDANQMLIALKRSNPDAFYRDNINALKTGAVLRIPSHEDAVALSAAAAAAAVRQENASWRSGAALPAPTTVAQAATHASDSGAGSQASASSGDRLALVSAASDGGGKASRQQRQRAEESLSVLQQQDAELKSRLKDLEDLNSKSQRLLALKDNEIAELQNKLADARKAAGIAAAPVSSRPASTLAAPAIAASVKPVNASQPSTGASNKPASIGTAGLATSATTAPAHAATTPAPVASTPAASKPASKTPARPVPRPAEEQTPWYAQPWLWLAALVVLLLVFLGLRGRRKPEPVAPSSSLADSFSHTPLPEQDSDQHALLDQLAEHPDDIGLHLELVSLYYSRRDVERFEAAAEAMHAHISDPNQPEWEDVVHMGEDLTPEHPLFAAPGLSPSHAPAPSEAQAHERDALEPFDLDHYAAAAPSPVASRMEPAELPTDSSSVAFSAPVFNHVHEPKEEEALPPPISSFEGHPTPDEPTVAVAHKTPSPIDHFNDDVLNEDAVDTKLDLARAYIDMGDPEGASAMLGEVLKEGSQIQRDVAQKLLDELR